MTRFTSIHIIALASLGQGISGGDRIYIELARRWSKTHKVVVYVWEEGRAMCERERLTGDNLAFHLVRVGGLSKLGFVFTYFYRILLGIVLGLTLKLESGTQPIVYSASEFWMDSLPALLLKWRYKRAIWAAAWYQTAPSPLRGFAEGARSSAYKTSALLYWLAQLPIKPLVAAFFLPGG